VASVVSAILGDRGNASIILVIILLSNILNFVQTSRSQNAVEKLRADVAPTASVLCNSTWRELPRREVVPGDLVRLAAGDLVPADARLVQATDLHVQQAALTGESLPVEKSADDGSDPAERSPQSPVHAHDAADCCGWLRTPVYAPCWTTGIHTVASPLLSLPGRDGPELLAPRGTGQAALDETIGVELAARRVMKRNQPYWQNVSEP